MVAALAAAHPAHAQPAEVVAQIKLIETQPADMDRATWKDRRRDAARKLGRGKDRRAVPVLIKLAETETFDIIGEIAIEGLGNLGDPAAAPALQKIIADPSRDKSQRDLARKALAKLGAEARPSGTTGGTSGGGTTGGGTTGGGTSGGGTTGGGTSGGGTTGGGTTGGTAKGTASGTTGAATGTASSTSTSTGADAGKTGSETTGRAATPEPGGGTGGLLGSASSSDVSGPGALPVVPDDALAAYERVTFAGGTANLGYDTARKRVDFDADVAGQYQKRIERETMAWGMDLGAHVVAGYVNPDGPAVTRGLQLDVTADGEIRFYSGRVYGIGRAAGATQLNYISDVDPGNANNTLKDTRFTADLQVALGGGYGRVLDVGAAIRVRRLARTLEAARALGRPIDPAIARRLQLTWWALRGERSTYRALVATVAILREAGILLGEPDAGLSYEILAVLRDSQLLLRPSGLDVQLAFGEGYLQRPDQPPSNESGRVEQVLASAAYGAQLDDDKLELSGGGYARLRLFAPDDQPSPWAVGASARLRRFTYGDHGDPLGALDVSGVLQISDDDVMNSQIGQRLSGQLGFTWWLNAASGIRLAASVGEDRGALFLGAELTATYGLLDGTFAR
ncbi:MAG TPA: HEAT repeat domain-containing protein [Kofleriaceae bacterium]